MPTLIAYRSPCGRNLRCDSACHNAKGTKCGCICGGVYHGAGLIPGRLKELVKTKGKEVLQLVPGFAEQIDQYMCGKPLAHGHHTQIPFFPDKADTL